MSPRTPIFRTLLFAAVLLSILLVMSCTGTGDTTTAEGNGTTAEPPATTEEVTTENPDEIKRPGYEIIHKTLYRSCLDWGHAYGVLPNGKISLWNTNACVKLEANLVSVYQYYRNPDGSSSACAVLFSNKDGPFGNTSSKTIADGLNTLKYSHEKGVGVIAALPNVVMNRADYTRYGYKWEDYAMQNLRGLYSVSNDGKYAYACINNPGYQKLIRDYTVLACRQGFDGMFFDGGSYSYGLMYNCCCQYCQASWKEYSLKYLGKETEIPTTAPTHNTKASRVFWKMRMDIYIGFVMDLWEECKAINPDYGMWPNLGINGLAEPYYTLHGLRTSITEYGANTLVNPGYNSTLYMFRQYEAENPAGMLISQFNDITAQASPYYKWKTAFVEAIAGNGGLMMPTSATGTSTLYPEISRANEIIDAHTEAFTDSASAASVAIVYSWQELNYCHMLSTGTMSFGKNLPRKAAAAFCQNGIPYDYIMPENTDKLYQLLRYDTIVFAEFGLISDEFAEMTRKYVEKGGQLLILGKSFAQNRIVEEGVDYEKRTGELLEQWTGKSIGEVKAGEVLTLGEGRIVCVPNWFDGTTEDKVVYSDALLAAFETLGLYDRVRVEEDVKGYIETTGRSNADSTEWWLHLVNYNCEDKWEKKTVKITLTLQENETVTDVKGFAIHLTDDELGLKWTQEGNKLVIEAVNNLWTMSDIVKTVK